MTPLDDVPGLTARQQRFVGGYAISGNSSDAGASVKLRNLPTRNTCVERGAESGGG